MREEITVEISPSGDVKISVKGVKGKSCKALTKGLEAEFGDVQNTHTTGEFNEVEQVSQTGQKAKS
jgi:hypothetical protein